MLKNIFKILLLVFFLISTLLFFIYYQWQSDQSLRPTKLTRYQIKQNKSYALGIDYDEETSSIHNFSTSRGFPMGGIGTGGFHILSDGGFSHFRWNHNWFQVFDALKFPKASFFAIQTIDNKKRTTKILRQSFRGGEEYKNIKAISNTRFQAQIPFFSIQYIDKDLNLQIEQSGFTSLIANNTKDSSLPLAFFSFKITNTLTKKRKLNLLLSFENLLGMGGSGGNSLFYPLNGEVKYNNAKKNYVIKISDLNLSGLHFKSDLSYAANNPKARTMGEYFLFTKNNSQYQTNHCLSWNGKKEQIPFVKDFTKLKELCEKQKGNAAAFNLQIDLEPNQSIEIPFYFLWWTPHYSIEKNHRLKLITKNHNATDYGHYYLNFFKKPKELITYAVKERQRLKKESYEIIKIINQSSLPKWLKNYIPNSTSPVLTNSILTKNGDFYTIEGMPWGWPFGALTGTIDQRLASHLYTYSFFNDLDLNEVESFIKLSKEGRVPHGNGHADIALGTNDIPYGDAIKAFNKSNFWLDLPQSLILQITKAVIQRGDLDLLKKHWPRLIKMYHFLQTSLVNHIPEGITTYDYMHYNPAFIYSAIMQEATLKALARLSGILASHQNKNKKEYLKWQKRFLNDAQNTKESYTKLLWNQDGYFHTAFKRDSIFTSALAGDWISREIGLGPSVDYKKAKSHSLWQAKVLVDSYKTMPSAVGPSRPLVHREATAQGEPLPAINNGFELHYVNNPWQSILYQGVEAIYLNNVSEGLKLIKRIWDKGWHEGYPFDMDHWGMRGNAYMSHPALWLWDKDHHDEEGHIYMTHTSTWGVLNALSGINYNAFEKKISVSPRRIERKIEGQSSLRIPRFFPDFWLLLEFDFTNKKGFIEVIKNFKPTAIEIKDLYYILANGEEIKIKELKKTHYNKGDKIYFTLP